MTKRSILAGGVALSALFVVTACGSSSSGGTTSASTPATGGSSSSSASTSGADIVIGAEGSFSGPTAGSQGAVPKVLNAWVSSVNDAGGIKGHKLKLIVKDDASSPATALTNVKELVEKDKVVAIVGAESNVDSVWASYVASKNVPVIGGDSFDTPFFTNPDFFPIANNAIAQLYGALALGKSVGPKFSYLYCAEAPQCKEGQALITGIAPALGMTVPLTASIAATAPDYTAVCQSVKNSGVNSYLIGTSSNVVVRVATACAQQGVKAVSINADGTVNPSWLTTPALDGTLLTEGVSPWFLDNTAAHKAYRDAISKYISGGLGQLDGPNSFYGWVSGKLFEKAAAAATGDITSASLKQGLYTLKGETLGGLTAPLTFTEGKPTIVNCNFVVGIKDGKFTDPKNGATVCAPDAVINGVLSKLG